MNGEVFVDTNVLVYHRDAGEGQKQARATAWLEYLWKTGTARLSVQILEEYYASVTRKLHPGIPPGEAQDELRDYLAWRPLAITPDLLERAFDVESRFGLSWWDSLVVAAAQMLGCSVLLSEDLQDGMDFDGVVVTNPFTHEPPSEDSG